MGYFKGNFIDGFMRKSFHKSIQSDKHILTTIYPDDFILHDLSVSQTRNLIRIYKGLINILCVFEFSACNTDAICYNQLK